MEKSTRFQGPVNSITLFPVIHNLGIQNIAILIIVISVRELVFTIWLATEHNFFIFSVWVRCVYLILNCWYAKCEVVKQRCFGVLECIQMNMHVQGWAFPAAQIAAARSVSMVQC